MCCCLTHLLPLRRDEKDSEATTGITREDGNPLVMSAIGTV